MKNRHLDPQYVGRKAKELFLSGWNCAEAVVLAINGAAGTKIPVELATGFGGGIGGSGSTCGALIGAVMALGHWAGRRVPDKEQKKIAYERVRKLFASFRESFYSTACWELTNCETEEARRKEICPPYVERAAYLAAELINDWVKEK